MRSYKRFVILIQLFVVASRCYAQNQSELKCDLPANIHQLPEFAQDEIRAVWKNYVPGDNCKKELLITDDILAVLDMFDKELEKNSHSAPGPIKMGPLITTQSPLNYETLITKATAIIDVESSTIPYANPSTDHPLVQSTDDDVDYSDFTTTSVRQSTTLETVEQKQSHHSTESGEQPFTYTGSPSATNTIEMTTTPRIELDYVEPLDSNERAITSKAIRISRVRIPTDYDQFNEITTRTVQPRRNNFKLEKTDKVLNEKFYESQEPTMPFLKGANSQVVRLFKEVMTDPDVVSEQRRQEEIHLLAVSYLNSKQLSAFNTWSLQRRKRIKAREQVLQPLSFVARDALKRLSLTPSDQERKTTAFGLPGDVRDELRAFAIRLREQHQPDYRHKQA
ncbi:Jud-4 [Aphelenchoides besseyi]|nr:Jud-4 [Aphelenchoides besseyi]